MKTDNDRLFDLPNDLQLQYPVDNDYPRYYGGKLMDGHSTVAWTWSKNGYPTVENVEFDRILCVFIYMTLL